MWFVVEIAVREPQNSPSFRVLKASITVMVASALFVSAPTVRFLRAVEKVRLLPAAHRQTIAVAVYANIKPLIGCCDLDELCAAARVAQDERWRLVSSGTCDKADIGFATVVITEQWLRAQIELVRAAAPIAEVLAEKRRDTIEEFIRDSLYADSGEVIALHAHPSSQTDRGDSSKTAA